MQLYHQKNLLVRVLHRILHVGAVGYGSYGYARVAEYSGPLSGYEVAGPLKEDGDDEVGMEEKLVSESSGRASSG